jgi:tetrapyrrole methylase family protein/MazG family protein
MDKIIIPKSTPAITLLGLGPGNPDFITRQAWQILETSSEIWLRTCQHPVVSHLPKDTQVHSFDHLYETENDFYGVYAAIVAKVLELAKRPEGVVYAVPGHPFVAEATAPEIYRQALQADISVRVIEGLSFLEPTITALGIDPFPHTTLIDALELVTLHFPPFPPSAPALIAQIYSRSIASDVKLTLNAIYPDEHHVQLIHAAGTSVQLVEDLKLFEIDRSRKTGLMTVLYLPPLGPATSFEAFQEVIAHLRAPEGCPWDKEQTHLSLRRYLLEESYETLQALDAEDYQAMCEEFGDLLLQIVLHAQIATESGEFSMNDVLRTVNEKIVRRHPHVFGEENMKDSNAVLQNWERLKAEERKQKGELEKDLFNGVAQALPALVQAEQYLLRAARVGYAGVNLQAGLSKIAEMLNELTAASESDKVKVLGDIFFKLVELSHIYQIDPESALREANVRFRVQFTSPS